jgi:ribosomal protein S18 acetylase RimI-like enzyme
VELEFRNDFAGVDWQFVSDTLRLVGMAYHRPENHKKAFENSYAVVFVYREGTMIGFGRAVSDGVYQSAVYDVAVLPEYRKQGIGTAVMKNLLERLPAGNVILYANIGREGFYEKLGFRRMKTAMARFRHAAVMREKGFTE